MSISERSKWAVAALLWLLPAAGWPVEGPGLGVALSEETVRTIDFTILPDGTGLPPGEGDVRTGLALFQAECRLCHGDAGQGGPNARLVGGRGSLASGSPVKTIGSYWPYATTLFDYIRRTMPLPAPGRLSDGQIYALSAYLLFENGIIDEDAVMNAKTLPKVRMPNRDGFVWALEKD